MIREPLYGTERAITDVLEERKRQVVLERHTRKRDDESNADGSLAVAAACYALEHSGFVGFTHAWPWVAEAWKPKDRRSNMVRAAALLIAEIERIDRAADSHPRKDDLRDIEDHGDVTSDRILHPWRTARDSQP